MKNERLFSLDVLRGLDMFMLTVVGSLVWAIHETFTLPDAVMRQVLHAWGGFTLWDIIMPLFIFMCGAAVPFGLGKRMQDGRPTREYWLHVASRVALLWVLGMIAQGRLLTLDILKISPFNNTLQSIASGYLVAALVYPISSARVRRAIPVVLALGYALALHFLGDYSPTGNVAIRFENWFVTLIMPSGTKALELADPGYSWWFTIPMFGAMTLCGMEATLLLTAEEPKMRRFRKLLVLGAVLLALGWAFVPWVPMIKHIYTVTFTAQAMGWSCLALALLFYLTDVLKFRRGLGLLTLFGQTALLAYMLGEVVTPVTRAFAEFVTEGVAEQISPSALPIARWFAASALLITVLYFRRKAKFPHAVLLAALTLCGCKSSFLAPRTGEYFQTTRMGPGNSVCVYALPMSVGAGCMMSGGAAVVPGIPFLAVGIPIAGVGFVADVCVVSPIVDLFCLPYDLCQSNHGFYIRIVDEDGRPLPGVTIKGTLHHGFHMDADISGTTDESGELYVNRLSFEDFWISASSAESAGWRVSRSQKQQDLRTAPDGRYVFQYTLAKVNPGEWQAKTDGSREELLALLSGKWSADAESRGWLRHGFNSPSADDRSRYWFELQSSGAVDHRAPRWYGDCSDDRDIKAERHSWKLQNNLEPVAHDRLEPETWRWRVRIDFTEDGRCPVKSDYFIGEDELGVYLSPGPFISLEGVYDGKAVLKFRKVETNELSPS